jgi:hypothetical protein
VSLKIQQFHKEFQSTQFLLGMPDIKTMRGNSDLIMFNT